METCSLWLHTNMQTYAYIVLAVVSICLPFTSHHITVTAHNSPLLQKHPWLFTSSCVDWESEHARDIAAALVDRRHAVPFNWRCFNAVAEHIVLGDHSPNLMLFLSRIHLKAIVTNILQCKNYTHYTFHCSPHLFLAKYLKWIIDILPLLR